MAGTLARDPGGGAVSEIVDFVNTQYDRIENAARAATDGPWRIDNDAYAEAIYSPDRTAVVAGGRWGDEASVFESTEDAVHIALHDPAYILADIASKRRILDEVVDEATSLDMSVDNDRRIGPRDMATEPYLGDMLLRLLAAPFSGEPGYDERWSV